MLHGGLTLFIKAATWLLGSDIHTENVATAVAMQPLLLSDQSAVMLINIFES